jgi:hypothetical protein
VNDADLPAIVVEGEKTAVAAQKLFSGHIATTWSGGASAMGQTDWVPLSGRELILVPDCDAPGRKAMQWLRNHLEKTCKSIRVVDPATFDGSLPEGWDLADAFHEKRDVSRWLEKKNDEPVQSGGIEAIPFTLDMLESIPPRKWLYRRHYMRGMVSLTAAAGGVGKSTVQLVEAISMVLGEDLLRNREELRVGPIRVWLHNGEDPLVELRRRIAAVVKHYKVDAQRLVGNLLLTSGRDTPMIAAQEIDGVTVLVPDTQSQVLAQIQKWNISALVLDPFVSTHRVAENSNTAIEPVMTLWRDIADTADIAVEIIHHFRKGNGSTEPSADDVRGATAMIGAARTVRLFAAMTKEEAELAAVEPKHRRRHIWEMNAKANMHAPTDERTWRELIGVSLENSDDVNDADEVGVAVSWEFPSLYSAMTPPMERAALRAIGAELDWDKRRKAKQSKNWVGFLVAEALGWDGSDVSVKRNISQLLDRFEEQKQLCIRVVDDPRQGRKIPIYEVAQNDPQ